VTEAGDSTVYVYGVLAASNATVDGITGVQDAPVRTVVDGDLGALVSDLAGDELTAAREVRAHWRVLEKVTERATVVPVRFGTVLPSDHAVREELLEPDSERVAALLAELAGRVQLSVKGDYDEELLLRGVVAASPDIAALRERVRALPDAAGYYDRIRLGELVAARISDQREADAQVVVDRLAPLAVATRPEPTSGTTGAFNIAFLVERAHIEAFSQAVAELGSQLGEWIRMRYLGPLPPYSFADAEPVDGGVAWA
jgi:Gas vesicle synthesis protein GvpL/GvpF